MSWPIDVMSVGEVNDEGLPLDMEVNMRLSRVCGLATWEMKRMNSSKTIFKYMFNICKS
jgi:hypothetical protein